MRIWEFEDNKALASDISREQDLVLKVRHLHRQEAPMIVINITLNLLVDTILTVREQAINEESQTELIKQARAKIDDFVKNHGGQIFDVSNGDVFIFFPDLPKNKHCPDNLLNLVITPDLDATTSGRFRHVWFMPQDYHALRERLNQYIEIVRAAALSNVSGGAAGWLRSEEAKGSLTALGVSKIEALLYDIQLKPYLRFQPIYERSDSGKWKPIAEECHVSFDALRQAHFPQLDVTASEHLFRALCHALDRRLLEEHTFSLDMLVTEKAYINLSVSSIMKGFFAAFAKRIPTAERKHIVFEIHRGDIFQDIELTIDAISVLRNLGFGVVIDGISPITLLYFKFIKMPVDCFKIDVSKTNVDSLCNVDVQAALRELPRDKLIFMRCDNEAALNVGIEAGVNKFQGWLIDDLAREK